MQIRDNMTCDQIWQVFVTLMEAFNADTQTLVSQTCVDMATFAKIFPQLPNDRMTKTRTVLSVIRLLIKNSLAIQPNADSLEIAFGEAAGHWWTRYQADPQSAAQQFCVENSSNDQPNAEPMPLPSVPIYSRPPDDMQNAETHVTENADPVAIEIPTPQPDFGSSDMSESQDEQGELSAMSAQTGRDLNPYRVSSDLAAMNAKIEPSTLSDDKKTDETFTGSDSDSHDVKQEQAHVNEEPAFAVESSLASEHFSVSTNDLEINASEDLDAKYDRPRNDKSERQLPASGRPIRRARSAAPPPQDDLEVVKPEDDDPDAKYSRGREDPGKEAFGPEMPDGGETQRLRATRPSGSAPEQQRRTETHSAGLSADEEQQRGRIFYGPRAKKNHADPVTSNSTASGPTSTDNSSPITTRQNLPERNSSTKLEMPSADPLARVRRQLPDTPAISTQPNNRRGPQDLAPRGPRSKPFSSAPVPAQSMPSKEDNYLVEVELTNGRTLRIGQEILQRLVEEHGSYTAALAVLTKLADEE